MLHQLKHFLYQQILTRPLIKHGWRPPMGVPLRFPLGRGSFGYNEEKDIKAAIPQVETHTMTSFECMATLWQQVRYLDQYRIPGEFIECGVWKGGAVGMMILAHRKSQGVPTRYIRLFDSFEGLPKPDAKVDGEVTLIYAGQCAASLEECQDFIERKLAYPKNLLNFHKGWFEETVPTASKEIKQIALLRLDGDWYESTKVCLENLYPKVVSGGVIILDDYGRWEGCRRAVDEFIGKLKEPVFLNHIDYSSRYWIKS